MLDLQQGVCCDCSPHPDFFNRSRVNSLASWNFLVQKSRHQPSNAFQRCIIVVRWVFTEKLDDYVIAHLACAWISYTLKREMSRQHIILRYQESKFFQLLATSKEKIEITQNPNFITIVDYFKKKHIL